MKRKNQDMDLQYRQPVISYRKTFPKLVLVDNASDNLYLGLRKKSCNCIFGLLRFFFSRFWAWFAGIRPADYLAGEIVSLPFLLIHLIY